MTLPAGAGKTKLVSTVVGSLRRRRRKGSQGKALAYFYCDRNQPDRQSHEQVMRSFVRQLSTPQDSDMIPSCIEKRYAEKEKPGFASSGLTFEECCALLSELVGMYTKVTLVLDALDECDKSTRHLLVNEIDKLVSGSTSCVIKVFISSRPDNDIKHHFQGGPNVCISATDNGADIRRFIDDKINNSPPGWLEKVTNAPGLREEIVTTLHKKADGMYFLTSFALGLVFQILIECYRFQWAKLQMDQLLRLVFVSDIRDFLGKLPKDLERAYDVIMDQIDSQEGRTPEIARRAFLWMMCSHMPLTPRMLANVVCRDPETGATCHMDIDKNTILEASRNLIMIDQSGVCRFSHLSVQEYLETGRYRNGQANLEAGLVCLQMLLDPLNWQRIQSLIFFDVDGWGERVDTRGKVDEEEAILKYTVAHWPDHVRLHAEGHIDDRLALVLKNFLGSPNEGSAAYMCWRLAFINYHRSGASHYSGEFLGPRDCLRPAFAVILFGLNGILRDWWTLNLDINLQDDKDQSLLYVAGLNGNLTAATELLDMGCDINAQGGVYGNALQAASWRGNEDVVRLLLDRGADVNAQGGEYGSALQAAAFGNEGVVRLLLDRGANVNAQGGEYGDALQAAAIGGRKAVVRLLLDRGADVGGQGGRYGNALQAAALRGREGVVRLLLDRGTDANAQGGVYGSALQAAALRDRERVVRLLLDRGADANAQGGVYGNALQTAAFGGNDGTVRLLLDRGADVNARGGLYGNALQAAAFGGNEVVVRLLLNRGADINTQGGTYGNALQAAAIDGSEVVVRLLLDQGADVNAQGGDHGNALQAAMLGDSSDKEVIIQLLLDRGADINNLKEQYRAQLSTLDGSALRNGRVSNID